MQVTPVPSETHEAIYHVSDPDVGLLGFIAIHSTKLGPAAGGLRMRPYAAVDAALEDVKRLSEGMTFKNAAAGLPLGGGKAVIIGDPATDKTPELLKSFARAIQSLEGRYITAEDMGMTPSDMAILAQETDYAAGLADGEFASGDPSPITAQGIFNAIQTTWAQKHRSPTLVGVTVAVQGLGNVGWHLCDLLHQAHANLVVTDVDAERIAKAEVRFSAKSVQPDEIYGVEADIFAPCAIGGILNAQTIPTLKVSVVAGGANNQLATPQDAGQLHDRGILYAPDFVANGGGIINVATEVLQIRDRAGFVEAKLQALTGTLQKMLDQAETAGVSPADIAIATVEEQMSAQAA
ncbi:amino acid dehydrogenase [Epibacterium sp. SM1979]|uniref:Amino acid dehydrogenase n=1 Tax=Tritonibacter litoralis TaxID=2662264 RepID=A0A843Y8U0_9RHOB|nr:Glu/Leu/Phe/Val dehydrogenase dimerization domain-containing protein [Tritonibacter litoralis]MQQ07431.1 amino acid dehydrogenase [Tritonibacter litoralis]